MTDSPESVPAVVSRPRLAAAPVLSFEEVRTFAQEIQSAEGLVPRHLLRQPMKIVATVLTGQEFGIGPMASLRAFHIVDGKAVADYSFWVRCLRTAGYRIEYLRKEPECVRVRLTAPDGSSMEEQWDKERAIKAGLWNGKDNWRKYPEAMLTARAITSAGRAFAADVMFGCYVQDEADEFASVPVSGKLRVTDDPPPEQPKDLAQAAASIAAPPDERQALAIEVKGMLVQAGIKTKAQFDELLGELGIPCDARTSTATLDIEALRRIRESVTAQPVDPLDEEFERSAARPQE